MQFLFLWDIDGTLIQNPHSSGGSLEECWSAVREVSGESNLAEPDKLDGSTDWQILREILRNSSLPEDLAPAALRALEQKTSGEEYVWATRRPLPGVPSILRRLGVWGKHTYATGNSRKRALAKSEAFGIDRFLEPSVGGFGDRSSQREEFVSLAIERGQNLWGPLRPIVLGDTPADIAAARATGALAVAIPGGVFSAEELHRCDPDLLLWDWRGAELLSFLRSL